MISNQSVIYQISAKQIGAGIKSIQIETWSPISTFSTIPYFDKNSIQTVPNIINQQQRPWKKSVYQNSLQPLMSLELDSPFHQQYSTRSQPIPLMSIVLPCYESKSVKSSTTRTKLCKNNRVCNHLGHNPKYYDRIKRCKYYRRDNKCKSYDKPAQIIATTHNVKKQVQESETTPTSYASPLDIHTIVNTETIELS